jgi:hypothetical protein
MVAAMVVELILCCSLFSGRYVWASITSGIVVSMVWRALETVLPEWETGPRAIVLQE